MARIVLHSGAGDQALRDALNGQRSAGAGAPYTIKLSFEQLRHLESGRSIVAVFENQQHVVISLAEEPH